MRDERTLSQRHNGKAIDDSIPQLLAICDENYLFAGFALLLCSKTFGQSVPLTGRCGDIRSVERSAVLLDGGSLEVDWIAAAHVSPYE